MSLNLTFNSKVKLSSNIIQLFELQNLPGGPTGQLF